MKPSRLAIAATLVLSTSAVLADDIVSTVASRGDDPGSFAYKAWHRSAGAFTDTYTFGPSAWSGIASVALTTFGIQDVHAIDFISAALNGHALTTGGNGRWEFGSLSNLRFDGGPLVLTVNGIAGGAFSAGQAIQASYAGTLEVREAAPVAAVPEPGVYALMLAGLGAIGFMARRRRKN